jgi:hypothetical protein
MSRKLALRLVQGGGGTGGATEGDRVWPRLSLCFFTPGTAERGRVTISLYIYVHFVKRRTPVNVGYYSLRASTWPPFFNFSSIHSGTPSQVNRPFQCLL